MKTLTLLALCVIFSSVLVSAQATPTDDDVAKLIAGVKLTLASQLDPALPPVTFEKWLRLQVGRDATIGWAVRTGDGHGLPWVEADVSDQGRPGIVIMISCGASEGAIATRPKFHSLELVRANEYAEWPRLRDLPVALRKARDGAK
ncbi:exported hypothetical protein [Candidatus Sulfotelmatobacter sp. SbA7]|nr:exported hypothetical protein [Candidatus Sulfotelmatobacter sp. SbA7]